MAGYSAALTWDFECLHLMAVRQVQLVRAAGALAQLPLFLSQLGMALAKMGDLPGTASLVPEIDNAAAAIGSPIAPYTLLRLRALQGREDEVAAVMTRAAEHARGTGQGLATSWTHWAEAVLNNGLAHYHQAAAAAQHASSDALNPWMAMWALPELVEAAERSQQTAVAHEALDRLMDTTRPCDTDVALGIEARCQALLSDGTGADDLYRKAIEHLQRTSMRPDLARTHLLYGEWLRRQNHRSMARGQLQTAHAMFGGIGMEAFAERARVELLAAGETARPRSVEAYDELTAQERQIAFLARDGLSNAEIGERLSVSPRTVEWHLRNVFGKLGIRSRRQLAAALANPGGQTQGV
jgi:DNA-binding CsgD family transcriptional regulator